MSRIGGSPIKIPGGVTLSLVDGVISAKGGKGEVSKTLPPLVEINIGDDVAVVTPKNNSHKSRALWGTARAMINNMVTGVSAGFTKNLTIHGVGYRAAVNGNKLALNLGFSHPVEMEIPAEISCSVENNTLVNLSSFNKEVLGQFASEVRSKRPPEPYKGKGVRYEGEQIRRKEGKKK
ncbi:MAG: 50S ribosomal protein L6 [Candidatus Puniceispirillales bacterium WSBS_2018_MAG_OTU23]